MSSFKVLFCDFCVVLLVGVTLALTEEKASTTTTTTVDDTPKGNCSCGGFPTSTPEVDAKPLLAQTPGLIVKCVDEGATTCKNLCTALATATKAKGPEILCNKLKEANELKLSAFYKICDRPWVYAEMTAEEPLCCDGGKVKVCPSVEKLNATSSVIIDAKTVM
ncbi:hypothetical protein ABMA28_011939 [Loxostege sticticalis]|uniref:Uncharacterized protein n=1 Tax=Loxostege sticticalis TaxID=481309 RepID=A0ABD0TL14_LOXSC